MIPSEVFPEKDVYIESPLPIDVDKAGNVNAVGNREPAIFKFDPEGKPLLTFGGPGQGPGYLQWPYYFDVNGREKTIFVADNIGLSLFLTDGTFIRRFRTFGPV
ncbi:MAG: hypothetical protein QME69_06435 [Candidatus Saccharicenans sp.]|nr:hypothetical protein [Candidatus Saccharicenans sp.]